jgi:hypothetical protein
MTSHVPPELDDLVAEARCDGPSTDSLQRLADEAAARAALSSTNRSLFHSVSHLRGVAVVSVALLGVFGAKVALDASSGSAPRPRAAVVGASAPSTPVVVEAKREAPEMPASAAAKSEAATPEVPSVDVAALPSSRGEKGAVERAKAPAVDEPSEGELLRRAYAASTTDPRRALALTAEHARRFPSGMLAEEREVITIEALARLGRADAARARAATFFAAHPGSAYRPRIDDALVKASAPSDAPEKAR